MADGRLALAQQLAHQVVEGLRQGGVGNVALVLVELAGDEIAAPCRNGLLQFVDQGGFPHSRIAGHRHQQRLAVSGHLFERGQQRRSFPLAPVQPGRDLEAIGHIPRAKHKRRNLSRCLPLLQALLQVGNETGGTLVTRLRHLGQEFEYEVRNNLGNVGNQFAWRDRQACQVAMHPFQRIVRLERQLSGQQAIQQDAQRIEIGAVISLAVHAAGLLGRNICPVTAGSRTDGCHSLARSSPAQVGQFHLNAIVRKCEQDVGGLDVVMHDAGCMERCQGASQSESNGEHQRQGKAWLACQYSGQALASERFQDHDRLCAVFVQGDRFEDFRAIEGLQQRIFVPQAINDAIGCVELEENDGAVANMSGKVKRTASSLANLLNDLIVAYMHRTSPSGG